MVPLSPGRERGRRTRIGEVTLTLRLRRGERLAVLVATRSIADRQRAVRMLPDRASESNARVSIPRRARLVRGRLQLHSHRVARPPVLKLEPGAVAPLVDGGV